ncbi:hypothetical protein [uncultured Winogradskyella sp.]|uniref:hypothetical protein n=1 Tax=uncultured Winogradskyella sp. TaxID=395353 RepID=UPI0030EC6218|tara:strand:- start:616 stop:1095 length:480 start_codon:yes stop_codon:yes gene_type:complete
MRNQKSIVKNEYIPISAVVGIDALPTRDSITKFAKEKEQTKEIVNYLNWKKSPNELVSFCRAVCETEVPKNFDFLIDLDDHSGGIEINATITQAIWNGMLPLNFIDLGYKTITIIEFENGIPERLNSLKDIDDADFKPRFALCSKSEKEKVISELKNCG